MNKLPLFVCLAVMAGVTYLVRMLPLVLVKKKIQNRFLLSFLYYIPYAVLSVMTIPAIFAVIFTYFSARSGRFAPKDCPTRVVAAVAKANPGIKHIPSAVRYKEFAATATVPNVAMVLVVIIPAEDIAIRSKAAGRLIRNTVFKIAQSGR